MSERAHQRLGVPDIPDGDDDALDAPEPVFSMEGRCERCLRFLRGDGRCDCEERE